MGRWMMVVTAVTAASCGRLSFDPDVTRSGDARGGSDAGSVGEGAGASACVDVAPTDTCADAGGFHRIQSVPSDCPTGTQCHLIEQVTTASQSITESAGNLLVAVAYGGQNPMGSNGGAPPNLAFAVTDTLGNTWHPGPPITDARYQDSAIQMFYALNIAGGANTVTATESAGQAEKLWTSVVLLEYDGVATHDAVDISDTAVATTGVVTSTAGSLTTRAGCDLVVGAVANGHVDEVAGTPVAGWAEPILDWWDPAAFLDNAGSGAESGTTLSGAVTWARGADDGWIGTQLAFRAASSTARCQPTALAFTTAPQGSPAACSAVTTLAAVDGSGAPTITAAGIPVALSGATFYADAACEYPITSVTIGAGTSATSFYYRASSTATKITGTADGYAAVSQ